MKTSWFLHLFSIILKYSFTRNNWQEMFLYTYPFTQPHTVLHVYLTLIIKKNRKKCVVWLFGVHIVKSPKPFSVPRFSFFFCSKYLGFFSLDFVRCQQFLTSSLRQHWIQLYNFLSCLNDNITIAKKKVTFLQSLLKQHLTLLRYNNFISFYLLLSFWNPQTLKHDKKKSRNGKAFIWVVK